MEPEKDAATKSARVDKTPPQTMPFGRSRGLTLRRAATADLVWAAAHVKLDPELASAIAAELELRKVWIWEHGSPSRELLEAASPAFARLDAAHESLGQRHRHRHFATASADGHSSGERVMAEMVYGQSTGISVPAGWYDCAFVGVEDRPDMIGTMGKNAGLPQKRMAWVFEVLSGQHRGERIPQETGTAAVLRSGALRILTGLNGGPMAVGQKVNTDTFVGRHYRVKVAVNPDSDKGNLHVADIEPPTGQAPAAPPPTAAPARAPAAPPPPAPPAASAAPPPPPQPQRQPDAEPRYWCSDGRETRQMSGTEIRQLIASGLVKDADVQVQRLDGSGGWQPAKAFGFHEPF